MSTKIESRLISDASELLEISKNFSNKYHSERISLGVNLFNEVSKFYPCSILAEINYYENNSYLEYVSVFLKHDKLKIEIRYDDYRKKYSIFAHTSQEYSSLSFDYKSYLIKDKEMPNKIGVLNTKKINDWVKYYEEIDEIYKEKILHLNSKVAEFKDKLSKLPVVWYPDNKSGYIENNGLRYQFEIYQDGFISESIRITGASSLETFLNLTNIA